MKKYRLRKSSNKDKKYMVITPEGKKIHFGAANHGDFILWTKILGIDDANDKRESYIARHSKLNEDWSDPNTPGFWSRWFLWEKPTVESAKRFMKQKFKIDLDL